MQKIYGLVLFLFATGFLFGQFRQVPLESGYELQKAHEKQIQKDAARVLTMTGFPPLDARMQRMACPEMQPGVTYVVSGDSAIISVDTFGLGGNGGSLTLILDPPLNFGTATMDETLVTYYSNSGLTLEQEIILVEFCKASGECQVLEYPIVIKRGGQQHVVLNSPLHAEGSDIFCVDPDTLPGNLHCGYFTDCVDNYDGEDQQEFYFSSGLPQSCFFYRASRFPGVDTVCLVLCDEFTVCDTFKVTIPITGDTLDLPFFDDFAYEGPYPSNDSWLDNSVYVNQTSGKNPPSIGVATFDGLRPDGKPYTGGYGVADYLTSKSIDLSGLSSSNNVVLSFYLQPKGLGFQPYPMDSLVVEFRKADGEWVQAGAIEGPGILPINEVPSFVFYAFGINDEELFHNAFQFRFKNYNPRSGAYSTWHLDYVYLDANRGATKDFSDIAFTEPPYSILETYTSMPWKHFRNHEDELLKETYEVHLYNHFPFTETANPSSLSIFSKEPEVELIPENVQLLLLGPGSINQRDLPSQENVGFENPFSDVYPQFFNNVKTSLNDDYEELEIVKQYYFDVDAGQNLEKARLNDTVRNTTVFSNYFSYDDGTAERAIESNGVGSQIAMEFQANEDDSLRAVMIHFPRVSGDVQNQLFNLQVWIGELSAEPDYSMDLIRPYYPDNLFDTLNGFTTYVLLDSTKSELYPLFIPAGQKFYVGWQQASSAPTPIPVGFDRNNPQARQFTYVNIGAGWSLINQNIFQGAVMLRPILGSITPFPTATKDIEDPEKESLHIIPNPAGNVVRFEMENPDGRQHILEIFNNLGQPVLKELLREQTDISGLPEGFYFVKITEAESKKAVTGKMIISR